MSHFWLTLWHSEWPKLYRVLAILSANGKVLHVVDKVLLSELSSMQTCLVGSNWEGAVQEYTVF